MTESGPESLSSAIDDWLKAGVSGAGEDEPGGFLRNWGSHSYESLQEFG